MQLIKHLLFFTLLCCSTKLLAQKAISKPHNKNKVVFIIVDGIAADMLKNNPSPRLDEIATVGAYSEAYVGGEKNGYSETPTISAVGYNSLITGVWANKHNVWGNSIKNPNYTYPTIFRLYKDTFPKGKTAIFSTWLDNRTKLLGEGLAQTNHVKVDYAFDGFELDTIRFPHDRNGKYIKDIDALVATEAATYIASEGPDLSWVYLQHTDDIGHAFGDSKQLTKAIKYEDSLIGKIYDAVKLRENKFQENWLFIVTTDHGRTTEDGKGHGGQTDRERSIWIITNSKNTNSYFKSETPAIVDIAPTMASFLGVNVPQEINEEWDGVSLLDPVDITNPKVLLKDRNLIIQWKNLSDTEQKVTLFTSETNHFKEGTPDSYIKIGEAYSSDELFQIKLNDGETVPAKILIKTSNTTLNSWVTQ